MVALYFCQLSGSSKGHPSSPRMARKPDDTPSSEKAAADKAAADKAAADKAAADEAAADKAAADKAAADKAAAEKGTPKRLRKANASKASTSDQTEDNKKKTSPPSSSSKPPRGDRRRPHSQEVEVCQDLQTPGRDRQGFQEVGEETPVIEIPSKDAPSPSNSIGSGEAAMSRAANHFVTKLIEGLNNKSPADGSDEASKKDTLKAAADAIRKSGIGSFDPKLFNMDALAAAIKDNNYILTEPLESFCGDPELEKEGLAYFASCLLSWAVTVAILGVCDWGLAMSHAVHVLFSVQFSGTSNKFGGLPLCKAYDTHVRQGLYQRDLHPGCSQPPVSSRNDKWKSSDSRGHKRSRNDSWNSYYNSHSSNYYWNKNWGSSSWGNDWYSSWYPNSKRWKSSDDKKDDDKKKKDEKSPGTSNGGGHHEPPPVDTSPTIPAAHSPESPDSAEAVRAPRVVHPEPLADTSVIALADLHRLVTASPSPTRKRPKVPTYALTYQKWFCYFTPRISRIGSGAQPRAVRCEDLGKPIKASSPEEHLSVSCDMAHPLKEAPGLPDTARLEVMKFWETRRKQLESATEDSVRSMPEETWRRRWQRKLEGNPSEWDETLWKSAIEETEAKTMIGPIPVGSLDTLFEGGFVASPRFPVTVVLLRDPSSGKASAFFHVAQPFGASSSVINYCRVSQALAHLGRILLALILINFLDDYFAPERASSVDSGYEAWRWLHVILGWRLKEPKCVGPTSDLSVLGLGISTSGGSLHLSLPEEKKAKIIDKIQEALSEDRLSSSAAAKLAGRLLFASTVLPSNACRPYLRECARLAFYSDATSAGGIGAVASAKDFVRPIYAA
ncbi:hypothetical protein FOZ60_011548, partial [Perkinsus olseni]